MEKLIYGFHDMKLLVAMIVVGFLTKQVSKAHNILRDVHNKRKQVIGLIYTKQLMSWAY